MCMRGAFLYRGCLGKVCLARRHLSRDPKRGSDPGEYPREEGSRQRQPRHRMLDMFKPQKIGKE